MRSFTRTGIAIAALALILMAPNLRAEQTDMQVVQKALNRTSELIKAERLDEALMVLREIQSESTSVNSKIDVLLGNIYLKLSKPARALTFFEQASFSTIDDAKASLGMAEANLLLGNLMQARRNALSALRANPDLINAHLVIAKVDDRSGNIDAARKRFKTLLRDQPENEAVAVAFAYFEAHRRPVIYWGNSTGRLMLNLKP